MAGTGNFFWRDMFFGGERESTHSDHHDHPQSESIYLICKYIHLSFISNIYFPINR